MKLCALIVLALCGWGGLVLGQDDPSKTRTLSVPALSGCSEYDIRYDWGLDLVATFHHYYDKDGDIDRATAGVLASRPHTNRTNEQKLKDAFLLIRMPPDFSLPPIYTADDGSGFFSYIIYHARKREASAIIISRNLYNAPDHILAGALAHEIAHVPAGVGGVENHVLIERGAAEIAGKRVLAATLMFIRERHNDYEKTIRERCGALPPTSGIQDDFGARIDSINRLP